MASFPVQMAVDVTFVRMIAEPSFFAVGPWLHDHIHRQLEAVKKWSLSREEALLDFGDQQRSLL
jgi:hypothetical protein